MVAVVAAAAVVINTRRRIVTRIEAAVAVVEMTIPIEEILEGNKNFFFTSYYDFP
jgi:hypothetical protein